MSCIRRFFFLFCSFSNSASSDQSQHLCSRSHRSRGTEGTTCAWLWHGEVRRLPAHFIHPRWQPCLLFTLCSAHMASKTHDVSTDYFLKYGGPFGATGHTWCWKTAGTSAPRPALPRLLTLCRSILSIPLVTRVILHLFDHLFCFTALFILSCICFCRNLSWMRGTEAEQKTTSNHLQNLIWPWMGSSVCYIICCLHSPGSPVFSLSAFYRMQICCSAPDKMHHGCNKYRIFGFLYRKDKLYVK